jgi:6-phosphogluconolactonase (cycloisomerase 2 family)
MRALAECHIPRRAVLALLAAVVTALAFPAAAGAVVDLTAVGVRLGDHPAYVRAVVDFTDGTVGSGEVEAVDAAPFDGMASLRLSHLRVQAQAQPRSSYGVNVQVVGGVNRIRIELRTTKGAFKYLSYAVVTHNRLAIDLWKSAPPSNAAEVRYGTRGCLTLDSWRAQTGIVRATGHESQLFEHQFQVALRGANGELLARRSVHSSRGNWSSELRYSARYWQAATLEASDASAKDGALVCLAQVRVTLGAAGRAAAAVYVTNFNGASISQYDVGTGGALRPKQPATVKTGVSPLGIAVGRDRSSVYVSTSRGLYQYSVGSGGVLTAKSPAYLRLDGPGWIAISPDGRSLYASGGGGIAQYDVGSGGRLRAKSPAVIRGRYGGHLVISPDGKSLYATFSQMQAGVAQFRIGAGGKLEPTPAMMVSTERNPGWMAISPTGRSLYVTSYVIRGVYQYNVLPGGSLQPVSPPRVDAGSEPEGIAVSPRGTSVYVADFTNPGNTVGQFDLDPGNALTPKSPATIRAGRGPEGITVSSDGKSVYVTNINGRNISQYSVGAGGKLTPKAPATVAAGANPYDIATR